MPGATPLADKSSVADIRARFDDDVERFSDLESGQSAVVDAPLMLALLADAAAAVTPRARRLLDVGCGAGNNTLMTLARLPGLDCDMVDISRPMLDRACQRVAAATHGAVRLIEGDIRIVPLPSSHYDIIIAAAVLHHLRDDVDWAAVFGRLYDALAPGGGLWISDLVVHDNPAVDALLWRRYAGYLESHGGIAYRQRVFAYIDREDSPRSVNYQLNLMREIGFTELTVLHKNACFAAFGGIKPPGVAHTT